MNKKRFNYAIVIVCLLLGISSIIGSIWISMSNSSNPKIQRDYKIRGKVDKGYKNVKIFVKHESMSTYYTVSLYEGWEDVEDYRDSVYMGDIPNFGNSNGNEAFKSFTGDDWDTVRHIYWYYGPKHPDVIEGKKYYLKSFWWDSNSGRFRWEEEKLEKDVTTTITPAQNLSFTAKVPQLTSSLPFDILVGKFELPFRCPGMDNKLVVTLYNEIRLKWDPTTRKLSTWTSTLEGKIDPTNKPKMKSKPLIESRKDKVKVFCLLDRLEMTNDYKIQDIPISVEVQEIRGKVEWKD